MGAMLSKITLYGASQGNAKNIQKLPKTWRFRKSQFTHTLCNENGLT
jgi:hypothetical protein